MVIEMSSDKGRKGMGGVEGREEGEEEGEGEGEG